MINGNDGFVVRPDLPVSPLRPRRDAWRKARDAGVNVMNVYSSGDRAKAEADAEECTKASGVQFKVVECVY